MDMVGVEGYDDEAIRRIIADYGVSGYRVSTFGGDSDRADLESRPHEEDDPEGTIDVLKYCGPVQGKLLREWGMTAEEIIDPDFDYEVKVMMVADIVFFAMLNPHPLGERNLYCASFRRVNDSIWGKSVPELMEDIQDICNACARAMVNNMGMASGPMVWYFADLIDPSQKMTTLHPWKQFAFTTEDGVFNGKVPMGFFQPDPIIDVLLKLYDYYFKQASEVTGIPAYIYGSDDIGGAGKTASGLSMLMNMASKGLKMVATNIDRGIIKPSVKAHWVSIMLDEPDKAKGDINIIPKASEYLIMMEQLQVRMMEFLNATANPIDSQIMGIDGRAELLRKAAKYLKMNTEKIVPDRSEILQQKEAMAVQSAIQNIAVAMRLPVEQLMQLAQGQGQMQSSPGLAPDGSVAGGRDARLM